MNERIENTGFINWGTTNVNAPSAFGAGATVNISGAPPPKREDRGADIGVITVIAEEASAVREALGLRPDQTHGVSFDLGSPQAGGKPVTIVRLRHLSQAPPGRGQR